MHHIRRIFRYLRYYPRQLVGTVLFNLLHVVFNLSSFVLIIPFVELLFGMSEPPATEPTLAMNQHALTDWMLWHLYQLKDCWGLWRCLLTASAAYLACSLLSNMCRYMGYYCVGPIRQGMIQRLRDDIYHKITILPVSYFSSQRRGDLLSRMSNDLLDIEWSIVTSLLSIAKEFTVSVDDEPPVTKKVFFAQCGNSKWYGKPTESAGISMSIPIYSRGQTKANVKKSRIALEQAQLDYEQSVLSVRQTVVQAYRNVVSAYNTYKVSQMKENAYGKSFNAYNIQYQYGTITTVELLQQQNNYLNALNAYIQNKYSLLMKRKILDVYMGKQITL